MPTSNKTFQNETTRMTINISAPNPTPASAATAKHHPAFSFFLKPLAVSSSIECFVSAAGSLWRILAYSLGFISQSVSPRADFSQHWCSWWLTSLLWACLFQHTDSDTFILHLKKSRDVFSGYRAAAFWQYITTYRHPSRFITWDCIYDNLQISP